MESNEHTLPNEDYERWVKQYTLRDSQAGEILFPLVSNLWMLARRLEKKAAVLGEEARIEDLSITATGE